MSTDRPDPDYAALVADTDADDAIPTAGFVYSDGTLRWRGPISVEVWRRGVLVSELLDDEEPDE